MAKRRRQPSSPAPSTRRSSPRGRRPRKVPEVIRAKLVELRRRPGLRSEPPSDEECARLLNGEKGARRYPRIGPGRGSRWTAPAVRSAQAAVLGEQRNLLGRLAAVIEAIAELDGEGVSGAEVSGICFENRLDPYWLDERFHDERFFGKPSSMRPLEVDREAGTVSLRSSAQDLLRHWETVEPFDPAALEVLWALNEYRLAPDPWLDRLCRRYHVRPGTLLQTGLVQAGAEGLEITETGRAAADQHGLDWDNDLFPTADEETGMPEDWDWDRRPFAPRDLLGDAVRLLWRNSKRPERSLLVELASSGRAKIADGKVISAKRSVASAESLERLQQTALGVYEELPTVPDLVVWESESELRAARGLGLALEKLGPSPG